MILHNITIDKNQIEIFCKKWKIKEFSLFGSVIREDFMPDSDVDVLVSFTPESSWSLWDMVTMQEELEQIFKRKVDLVEKEGLRSL
ncbi:MAG: nucleotidyltransferase domain-containing protein [Candidatus Eremiobacteraeota bacterium]|nr:nucleotidyltransferase domain-containing protein [Candidatus Eremiobacteraeota bacterium]MCL5055073.1 nucleotidyltransferase domain-containing protein [Bacillota bacterium]